MRQNFKIPIGYADSPHIRNWRCPIPREFNLHRKIVWFYSGSVKIQMHVFFTSANTHLSVSHPRFLGLHSTLPCVLVLRSAPQTHYYGQYSSNTLLWYTEYTCANNYMYMHILPQ